MALERLEIQKLVRLSFKAKERAYCPYSKFRVGAALLCEDGAVYLGCNVENASYGLSICAERTAMLNAISGGHRNFTAIAIASDVMSDFITPCGACRQFLAEFGTHWDVITTKSDGQYRVTTVTSLLPNNFSPDTLELNNEDDSK